mgnify:FL=1|jgi:hypothetical protein
MSDEYIKIKKRDIGEIIISMERDWDNLNKNQKGHILQLCDLVGFSDWMTVNTDILANNRLTWEQERGVKPREQ